MVNGLRIIRNILSSFIKLSFIPAILYASPELTQHTTPSTFSSITGGIFILLGLYGMMSADLLILRFGDGKLYFSRRVTKLVNVGLFAHNRHPFFWFFSVYQLGFLLVIIGFSWWILIISLSIFVFYLLILLLIQEPFLLRKLGKPYTNYKKEVPFWYWKIKLTDNLKIGFRSQAGWLIGMLIIRYWFRVKVEGLENIPDSKPFLIVSNHECYFDPFLFAIFVPYQIKFVTTADVFATPLMRFLLQGSGSFPMRRHRQDLKSIRTMIRMINKGQVVCIFPEGGRSTDGSPLPILNETLKLIQHCKVPILPVHLDGAYEIWPRWAPNRRRGKVNVSFNPLISLEDQSDLKNLEHQIKTKIFAREKVFRPVKSRFITRGMEHMLWACYSCFTRNSIEVTSGHSIRCKNCGEEWQVGDDYSLKTGEEGDPLTSIQWIKMIENDILEHPLDIALPFTLEKEEEAHVHTSILRYHSEETEVIGGGLRLTLSNQRMVLSKDQALLQSWSLANITIFTMDYFNAVSIGVGGVRHTFKLPPDEITLKWQTYFDTLKAEFETIDIESAKNDPNN